MSTVTDLRARAAADGRPNAGPPTHYALEAGRRIHLWPAPAVATPFSTLYTRPLAVEIVPPSWEALLLHGILGRYGQHFDRDALSQKPEYFERRYEDDLRRAKSDSWDVEVSNPWGVELAASGSVTADSANDTATDFVMPASLTGIGYVCVYPLEVT